MGLRGPRARGAVVAFAAGETRPSRVGDAPDLPEARSCPPPPASLRGEGRREWLRLAAQLTAHGLLREADLTCFEDYCRALSDLRAAERKARRLGLEKAIATGVAGATIKLRGQVASLRNHLGLSPVSRNSVRQVGGGRSRSGSRVQAFLSKKRD